MAERIHNRHTDWWVTHPPRPSSLRAVEWENRYALNPVEPERLPQEYFDKPGCQFVYFIEYGQLVKVGISKYPWFRFSVIVGELRRYGGLQHINKAAGPGASATVRFVAYGGERLETAIHRYLMRDHFSGEWFWMTNRVRRVVQHVRAQGLLRHIDDIYPLKGEAA